MTFYYVVILNRTTREIFQLGAFGNYMLTVVHLFKKMARYSDTGDILKCSVMKGNRVIRQYYSKSK
jgi:hypothetical protein